MPGCEKGRGRKSGGMWTMAEVPADAAALHVVEEEEAEVRRVVAVAAEEDVSAEGEVDGKERCPHSRPTASRDDSSSRRESQLRLDGSNPFEPVQPQTRIVLASSLAK